MACPKNEELDQCGRLCELTCENPFPVELLPGDMHLFFESWIIYRKSATRNALSDVGARKVSIAVTTTLVSPTAVDEEKCTKQCIVDVCQCKPGFFATIQMSVSPIAVTRASEYPR
ncbi:hypothetical protein OESDEN_15091 [Oesophagostomum dentatum]|uniref:Uncharacterized protein n=1 Tax=Oesophagostomum dentatum TaxID=61180 RepID=A0A0B1SNW4_OESDE|nr:hypothetical protein OESDEN_15091 [Oesophagostomum dentatum]